MENEAETQMGLDLEIVELGKVFGDEALTKGSDGSPDDGNRACPCNIED